MRVKWLILLMLLSGALYSEQRVVGVVSDVENEVYIVFDGKEKRLDVGSYVEKGSKVVTKKDSRAKIMMMDDSLLVIAPNTELSIDEYLVNLEGRSRSSMLSLIKGKVLFYINRLFRGESSRFQVKTRTSVAGVRGTKFVVENTENEVFAVIKGEVEVESGGKKLLLSEGKYVDSSKGLVVSDIDAVLLKEYDEGFKIKGGRCRVAMLERGTGLKGESLLEQNYKIGTIRRGLLEGEGESRTIYQVTEEESRGVESAVAGERRDTSGPNETYDISDIKGTDGTTNISDSRGNLMIKIRILLPFVKAGR